MDGKEIFGKKGTDEENVPEQNNTIMRKERKNLESLIMRKDGVFKFKEEQYSIIYML